MRYGLGPIERADRNRSAATGDAAGGTVDVDAGAIARAVGRVNGVLGNDTDVNPRDTPGLS